MEILRKLSQQKLVCGKSFARFRVCQRGQKCMLHAILQVCMKYPMLKIFISHVQGVKSPFDIHCVTAVFLMSHVDAVKVHSSYTVHTNMKSSNYIKISN